MTSNTHPGRKITEPAGSGHDPAELGELERSILTLVWRMSAATAGVAERFSATRVAESYVRLFQKL